MSYERFLASIKEPALVVVAKHWNAARGDRSMPGWGDIDPVQLGRYLPIVWAWRYDFAQGTFVGRLAGEEIIAVLGVDIRGRRLEECFRPDAVEAVGGRYKAVLDGPRFLHSEGKVYRPTGGNGLGERIVMPLAADGERADGIIGATVYRLGIHPTFLGGVSIDHHNAVLEFFPLED